MIRLTKRNVADSPFAKLALRAEDLIRRKGGSITRNTLSRALHVRPRELDEIIQKMICEEIIEVGMGIGTGGRPSTVYRLIDTSR